MASLYVTVFPDAQQTALGDIAQTLTIATISGSTQPTGKVSQIGSLGFVRVRVFADGDCWLAMGTAPDATNAAARLPLGASNPEYFTVPHGHKFDAVTR